MAFVGAFFFFSRGVSTREALSLKPFENLLPVLPDGRGGLEAGLLFLVPEQPTADDSIPLEVPGANEDSFLVLELFLVSHVVNKGALPDDCRDLRD